MLLATLERRRAVRAPGPTPAPQPATHLLWFCDAMLLFFAVPWLTTRVLGVAAWQYIGIEIVVTLVFLASYVAVSRPDLRRWRDNAGRSLALGVPSAAILVALVIAGVDSTARPVGWALAAALVWRGVVDAVATSLLLVAFPASVARELARTAPARVEPWMRTILSLVLVWSLSAAHHLGFEQYDDRSLLPVEVTSSVVAIPMVVSASPAGSVVAQLSLHVGVILEGYETDAVVPPEQRVVRNYEPPGLFPPPEVSPGGPFPR